MEARRCCDYKFENKFLAEVCKFGIKGKGKTHEWINSEHIAEIHLSCVLVLR